MDRSELLFRIVDVVCNPLQNYKKFKGITKVKNVVYDECDTNYCSSDFYYKTELLHRQKLPVIINIHGGGFVKGDKKYRASLCSMYADAGWFVINANYRLSPKHVYPTALIDIFKLLSRLDDYAETYDLDLSKIVLTGDSAGAYYAAHTVAALSDDALCRALSLKKPNVSAAGLMAFSGAYDIEKAFCKKLPFGITRVIAGDLIGTKVLKDFSNVKDFALFDYLTTTNFVNDKWPKTFLTFAKKDIFVAGQGETMAERLRNCGVEVTVDSTEKLLENHCYHLMFFTKPAKRCMQKALLWLAELKKQDSEN